MNDVVPSVFADASRSFEKIIFMFFIMQFDPTTLTRTSFLEGFDIRSPAICERIKYHRQCLSIWVHRDPDLINHFRQNFAAHLQNAKRLAFLAINDNDFNADQYAWTFEQVVDDNFFPGGNDETRNSTSA